MVRFEYLDVDVGFTYCMVRLSVSLAFLLVVCGVDGFGSNLSRERSQMTKRCLLLDNTAFLERMLSSSTNKSP